MAHSYVPYVHESEKILWEGVVSRTVLLFFGIFYFALLALFCNRLRGLPVGSDYEAVQGFVPTQFYAGVIFAIGGLIIFFSFLGSYLKRFVITDKRVLLISGIIGVDVVALSYGQIKNASLDVGLVGKLFGVGDVLIDSGKIHSRNVGKQVRTETKYDIFQYVSKPDKVYGYIQEELMKRS